jgi:hypothetical protein
MLAGHLTAEYPVRVQTADRTIDEWSWKVGADNDLFDALVACHVAGSIKGISMETGGKTRPTEKKGTVSMAEMQKAARERRRLG